MAACGAIGPASGCPAFQTQHVTRQIVQIFLFQREGRHDGAWRHRLRLAKVSQVPLPIGAVICHIGEIGSDHAPVSVNPVTGHAVLLREQRLPPRHRGVRFRGRCKFHSEIPSSANTTSKKAPPEARAIGRELGRRSGLRSINGHSNSPRMNRPGSTHVANGSSGPDTYFKN